MRSVIRSGRLKLPQDLDFIAFDLVAEIGLQPSEFADWPTERVILWHMMASERRKLITERRKQAQGGPA